MIVNAAGCDNGIMLIIIALLVHSVHHTIMTHKATEDFKYQRVLSDSELEWPRSSNTIAYSCLLYNIFRRIFSCGIALISVMLNHEFAQEHCYNCPSFK